MIASWLSRSTSSPVGFPSSESRRKKVEVGPAFQLLENHWKQATTVMDNPNAQSTVDALTVISHLNQMISFVKLTRNEEDKEQSCKRFWIQNKCSDTVLRWLHGLEIQGTQLEYENEKKLVQTLESLCDLGALDGDLLGFGNVEGSNTDGEWDGAYSLSSLLLEYSLKTDPELGNPARNAFIILIRLSGKLPFLEKCFSIDRELTNVVISGLSACFAQLPTFYAATELQIEPYVTQIKFVDEVIHASPPAIARRIADCFSNTFLDAVIFPAITQDEGNRSLHRQDDQFATTLHEEIAVVSDYLTIVCENLTHSLLVKSLVDFVLRNLLCTLVRRMNHQNDAVSISTLGLLNALLKFYTEDLWYELVLKHLMSQNYLMVSQRSVRLPEIDYQDSSLRFLSLIPTCIVQAMGPEAIIYHYTKYLDAESNRVSAFIGDEFPFPHKGITVSLPPSLFSKWKFKYDGTDVVSSPTESTKTIGTEEPNEFLIVTQSEDKKDGTRHDPVSVELNLNGESHQESHEPFTTISLQPTDEQLHSLGTGSEDPSNPFYSIGRGSDGYGSLEVESSNGPEAGGSYGPILDALFLHLKNIFKLSPDMVLMVTDLLTTLAGCRIPLVQSVLLDTKIILQPSYVSFHILLNRIRVELDQSLKDNITLLNDVWCTISKEVTTNHESSHSTSFSLSSSASMNFIQSLSSSLDHSIGEATESIKRKINTSNLLNNVFQRRTSIGSIGRASSTGGPSTSTPARNMMDNRSDVDETQFTVSPIRPPNFQPFRPTVGHSQEDVPIQNDQGCQPIDSARIMATRAIYFSHWLLELASVAHQLCWRKPDSR